MVSLPHKESVQVTESRPTAVSYIRAFRPLIPSESMRAFLKHAGKQLEKMDFEATNPLLDPRIYALNSLRITLFERRAQANQDAADRLNKLYAAMAQPTIVTSERRRTRPGVFETTSRRQPNPLIRALVEIENHYMQDGEEVDGKVKLSVRASEIMETTEDDYRASGTELALVLDNNSSYSALEAQRGILEDKARGLNAAKGLVRPLHQDRPLVVPFMVAPFDSDGQRDEFVDAISSGESVHLPVYGNSVGPLPVQWQLKT